MIDISGSGLSFLEKLPSVSDRALENSLDRVAIDDCKPAVLKEMMKVFDNPTRYTLNSLKVTPTLRHNMIAHIWFKDPDRMEDHYLLPQVKGGPRKLKGFERAMGGRMFIPGVGARRNKYGNVPIGQIRQILSVLGKAERAAGYSANITTRSAVRNKAVRDYVQIKTKRGRLLPGVYKRKAKGARGARTGSYKAGQKGRRGIVRARGLVPILLEGRQGAGYRARFDFYAVVNRIFIKSIGARYIEQLERFL